MKTRIITILTLTIIFALFTLSTQAAEPTWLFTVPKAESLDKGHYNIGFIYFDFGIADNLELGIHGIKYAIPGSNVAVGASIFPLGSPYIVFSPKLGSGGGLNIGIKAAPYIFFAGIEAPISNNLKFIAELNNGLTAGLRILPSKEWTFDLAFAFYSVEVYRYEYSNIEIKNFHPIPWIQFAYSGKF